MVANMDALRFHPKKVSITDAFCAEFALKLRLSSPELDYDSYGPSEEGCNPHRGPSLQTPMLSSKLKSQDATFKYNRQEEVYLLTLSID